MLTKDEVKHIAKLARLGLSEKEIEKLIKDLGRILDSVDELQEVDTRNVEPIAHITGRENAVRQDDVVAGGPEDADAGLLIPQAPRKKDGYVEVPEVLKEPS